jgi:hypothetical protein
MKLVHWLRLRRGVLRRAALASAVAVPLACAVAALFFDDPAARRFLLAYVAPFFVAFPLWARCRLARVDRASGSTVVLDAVVVGLGAARFLTGLLPFSGHMLFFVYSLLTERTRWYRILALVLIAETAYFKLVLWNDARSFSIGAALGVGFAALYWILERRRDL